MSPAPKSKAGGRHGGLHPGDCGTLGARLSVQGSAAAVKDPIMLVIF